MNVKQMAALQTIFSIGIFLLGVRSTQQHASRQRLVYMLMLAYPSKTL
jgi:hypothetical protein